MIRAEDQPQKPRPLLVTSLRSPAPVLPLYTPPTPNLFVLYHLLIWREAPPRSYQCVCACSVHPFATVDGSTVTRDLMLIVLQVKLVVIGQLRQRGDRWELYLTGRRRWRRWRSDLPLLLSGCACRSWWWSCSLSPQTPPPWCSWENMNG